MKKIISNGNTYWYNVKLNALFGDYRMTNQVSISTLDYIASAELSNMIRGGTDRKRNDLYTDLSGKKHSLYNS